MEPSPYAPPAVQPPATAGPPVMPPQGAMQPPGMPFLPGHPYHGMMMPQVTPDDRNMAALCHLLGIVTGFLGPLIIWLVKKDTSAFVNHHGREALNFQITMLLVSLCLMAVIFVLMLVLVGFLLIPLLFVLPIVIIVLEVLAGIAASRGEWHRYPFCIRMI